MVTIASDLIQWVIIGGESGRSARPFEVRWARQLIEQCRSGDVACFVKQLGADPVESVPGAEATREVNQPYMGGGWSHWQLKDSHGGDWGEWPEDLRVREFPIVAVPA